MAAVYAADDPTGARAAVKLLHPEMGLRRETRERFIREAAAATSVGHPGAVTVLEQGQHGDTIYLVMELLLGESLGERARRHGRLPVAEVLSILDQVLDVLAAAHAKGIIHRDLKPENLFLTADGRIKVLDFGLARCLAASSKEFLTRTGMALGTLPYMAPEQALGRRDDVDARADLFSLGATAFRVLSGRRVHDAPSEAELLMAMASQPAPSLATVAPDVPADLCLIVDRSLAFAKEARYPDALTMQCDVRAVAAGQRPGFAVERLTLDDGATRADRKAPVVPASVDATVPFPVPVSVRESTARYALEPTIDARLPQGPLGVALEPTLPEPVSIRSSAVAPLPVRRSRRRWPIVVVLLLAGTAVAGVGGWAWHAQSQPPSSMAELAPVAQSVPTVVLSHTPIEANAPIAATSLPVSSAPASPFRPMGAPSAATAASVTGKPSNLPEPPSVATTQGPVSGVAAPPTNPLPSLAPPAAATAPTPATAAAPAAATAAPQPPAAVIPPPAIAPPTVSSAPRPGAAAPPVEAPAQTNVGPHGRRPRRPRR